MKEILNEAERFIADNRWVRVAAILGGIIGYHIAYPYTELNPLAAIFLIIFVGILDYWWFESEQ